MRGKENMMALFDIKKLGIAAALGFVIFIAGTEDVSAQSRREVERERQRVEREQRRLDRQRDRNRNTRVTRVTERRVDNANYNNGYQQGLLAGQYDARKRKYNQSNVYRDTGINPTDGDPASSDYIYRQGYLQGYEAGFHGRQNY